MAREDELIRQIQNGRQECLDELIEIYYPAILRYCLWHMPDTESAQDATQETFLKLVRFISRYEHRGQFRAFLYRIAANACIDIKRNMPASEPMTEEMLHIVCRNDTGYQAAEDRQLLTAALKGLEHDQREIVLLRYGQELTLKEIASVTGMPLRTVQTRLRRALKKMKAGLSDS